MHHYSSDNTVLLRIHAVLKIIKKCFTISKEGVSSTCSFIVFLPICHVKFFRSSFNFTIAEIFSALYRLLKPSSCYKVTRNVYLNNTQKNDSAFF